MGQNPMCQKFVLLLLENIPYQDIQVLLPTRLSSLNSHHYCPLLYPIFSLTLTVECGAPTHALL